MDEQQFFTVLFIIFLMMVGFILGVAFCGYKVLTDFQDDGILEFGMGKFNLIPEIEPGSVCWEYFSKPSPNEIACLEIAASDFSKVCAELFNDEYFCFKLWQNTEIRFNEESRECIIDLPVECGGAS